MRYGRWNDSGNPEFRGRSRCIRVRGARKRDRDDVSGHRSVSSWGNEVKRVIPERRGRYPSASWHDLDRVEGECRFGAKRSREGAAVRKGISDDSKNSVRSGYANVHSVGRDFVRMSNSRFWTDERRRVASFQKEYPVVSRIRNEVTSASEIGHRARISNLCRSRRTSRASCESRRPRTKYDSRRRIAYDMCRMVDEEPRHRFVSRRRVRFEEFQRFTGSREVGRSRVCVTNAGNALRYEYGQGKGAPHVF